MNIEDSQLRKARGIFRLQTSDFRLHTSKFRLQISESLFPDFLRHWFLHFHTKQDTSRFPQDPQSLCNYVGLVSFSKKYLHIITHCIKNILCILYICMKVETSHYSYIMTASLIGRAFILVKMSVETFKTRVHLFFLSAASCV